MSLLEDAKRELTTNNEANESGDLPPEAFQQSSEGDIARLERSATVTIEGEEVTVEEPETTQTDEDTGTWIGGANKYGIPRGIQALENRQIVETSAMQSIVNGVADQVLGGELTFEMREDVDAPESQVEAFRDLMEDVLEGPHAKDASLDDMIMASINEMMGVGQAHWQLLPSEDGSLPVAQLIGLDSLTIRHNYKQNGMPGSPRYWQARSAFAGGDAASLGQVDPTPLEEDQLAVMSYPRGHRFNQTYPISPAWQVRKWLEILANSTKHHNLFYADNKIPPGLIQVVGASNSTIQDIEEQIENASGDPRDVPIVGGEGGAQWLDMGGTAVNLNIIEEQKWFFQLCLGALGLGKQELGMIEDVNRSNGEVESTRVYKRVAGPFIKQFEEAFVHICEQFPTYHDLGKPFTPTISFSDPREERAREQRLREMYQAGGLTLREYVRRRGDTDLATDEERYTVEVGGETIDYGGHPRWVAQALLQDAGDGVEVDTEPPDDEEQGESE